MKFYISEHPTAVVLGFGGGYIPHTKTWDFSFSIIFWTFGIKYMSKQARLEWKKLEEREKELNERMEKILKGD